MPLDSLQSIIDTTFTEISRASDSFTPQLTPREAGTITSVATGIAKVAGLPGVGFEELVKFPGDLLGIAFNLDDDEIGVVLQASRPSWIAAPSPSLCRQASKSSTRSYRSDAASETE